MKNTLIKTDRYGTGTIVHVQRGEWPGQWLWLADFPGWGRRYVRASQVSGICFTFSNN